MRSLQQLVWTVVRQGPLWDYLTTACSDSPVSTELLRSSWAVKIGLERPPLPAARQFGPCQTLELPSEGLVVRMLYIAEYFCNTYVLGSCFCDTMTVWTEILSEFVDTQTLVCDNLKRLQLSRFFLNLHDGNEFFTVVRLPGGYTGLIVIRFDMEGVVETYKVLLDTVPVRGDVPGRILKVVRASYGCRRCGTSGVCPCLPSERDALFRPSEVFVPSYAEFVRRARFVKPRRHALQLVEPSSGLAVDLGAQQHHEYFFQDSATLREVRERYYTFVSSMCLDPFPDMPWPGLDEVDASAVDLLLLPPPEEEGGALDGGEVGEGYGADLFTCLAEEVGSVTAPEEGEKMAVVGKRPRGSASQTVPAAKAPRVECEVCGATFSKLMNLKRHRATIHEGRRAFKCPSCALSFNQKIHLDRHITARHTEAREHLCSLCGMSFAIKNNLSRHVKSVHLKVKPFACSECPLAFADRADLRKHITRRH